MLSDMGHLLDGLQKGGTPEQQAELSELFKKYADVFAAPRLHGQGET